MPSARTLRCFAAFARGVHIAGRLVRRVKFRKPRRIDSSGRAVVVGGVNGNWFVARFRADGSAVDPTFGAGTATPGRLNFNFTSSTYEAALSLAIDAARRERKRVRSRLQEGAKGEQTGSGAAAQGVMLETA